MDELAEGALRLGDGHSHWDTDIDVRLVACRTFHVKHFSLPKLDIIGRENLLTEELLLRVIKHAVQQQGILHRHLYLLRVIDVNGGLEGEGLRVDGFLGTMVVEEVIVVRRAERQLLLQEAHLLIQLLVGLARLHLLLLGGEIANLPYELGEPRLLGELGVVIKEE